MAGKDVRYLQQRHQSWFFVIGVPRELHGRFLSKGRRARGGQRHPARPLTKIVVPLKTQSLSSAQELRWQHVTEWKEAFKCALEGTPLTIPQIDAEAREHYHDLLDWMDQNRAADREEEAEKVSASLDAAAEALEGEEWEAAEAKVRRIEQRKGRTIERGSKTHALLARALLTARVEACDARLHFLRGETFEEPATYLGADGLDPATGRPIAVIPRPQIKLRDQSGLPFSDAAERYIAWKQRDPKAKRFSEHTRRQRETVYRLFQSFTNDAPLTAIDKATASDFLDQVGKLDPNWHSVPDADKLSLRALVEKCAKRPGRLSNRTLNEYVSALSVVFQWAETKGHFEGRNPFHGQRFEVDKDATLWKKFEPDDLKKLFNTDLLRGISADQRIHPAKYTFDNAMCWIPLIALFSGMRSNEICQMRASDVQNKDGIWIFNVTDEADGQSLKTKAARRIVPVHSELIRCGFLDYLKALPRDGQLWPALKPGGADGKFNHYFVKRFTDYRRACGATADRTSFHSLRKNTAQALKDAGATPAQIAELLGHEQGFTLKFYAPQGLPLPVLKELIERVKYPGLLLDHLKV